MQRNLNAKVLCIAHNIPAPYRLHTFTWLNHMLRERGGRMVVYYMAKGHGERPKSWLNPPMDFPYEYFRDFDISRKHHHFNPWMIIRILVEHPDVLYIGSLYDSITSNLLALLPCAKVKIALIEGQSKTPGKMHGFVGWWKRVLLSHMDYVSLPGRDAVSYIEMHQSLTSSVMPKPILLPNLIDETRFRPRSQWQVSEIEICRNMFQATEKERVCLIPARLADVKGIVPFLRALDAKIVNAGWRIVILGQGHLKQAILDTAVERGIEGRLTILDYIPYDQMPICYAAADLMLLPSLHDPNPLSVPEALHSGLPIALSDQAGNVEEGVTVGRNGWRLPVNDSVAFKAVLAEVFSTPKERLREMGECSRRENATFWNTEKAVARFLVAVGL